MIKKSVCAVNLLIKRKLNKMHLLFNCRIFFTSSYMNVNIMFIIDLTYIAIDKILNMVQF